MWQDNPEWRIFHADDANDLYQRSVVKEFHEKKPRHVADAEAYSDWRTEAHAKAAAHHLRGMKAAQGAGDMEQARKHGEHYNLHMAALQEDPYGPVPDSVKRHTGETPTGNSIYNFKSHPVDALAIAPPPPAAVQKADVSEDDIRKSLLELLKSKLTA